MTIVILSAAKDLGCEQKKAPIRGPDPSALPQDDTAVRHETFADQDQFVYRTVPELSTS